MIRFKLVSNSAKAFLTNWWRSPSMHYLSFYNLLPLARKSSEFLPLVSLIALLKLIYLTELNCHL
ncbi:hypothetical protein [Synechocystis sp. PCC 7509]|uniref:hypothetical protein n=1 Tax=Synechocystis sp. PCC 7509 TaxID=927677 RepID=UPI0011DCBFB3|nr:hypothetical protein [Synechocystis sp. PCC 7509]